MINYLILFIHNNIINKDESIREDFLFCYIEVKINIVLKYTLVLSLFRVFLITSK